MDKLLNAADIAERYRCSLPTARSRMRQMNHLEKPLLVYEHEVERWELCKSYGPGERVNVKRKKKKENVCLHGFSSDLKKLPNAKKLRQMGVRI